MFYSYLVVAIDKIKSRKKYMAQVKIAGSVFSQPVTWKPGSKEVFLFDGKLRPSFVINANFGPYQDNDFVEVHKEAFRHCSSVSFRDRYSYSLFSDLPNALCAPDVVFCGKFGIEASEKSDNIVISVIDIERKNGLQQFSAAYMSKIAEISELFVRSGYSVTLMSFCGFEGDEEAVEKIRAIIDVDYAPKVYKYFYNGNINEALKLIADSAFVVATRFHSMILGWYFNKNIFPIVYGEKMQHYIEDTGFSGCYCNVNEISRLDTADVMQNFNGDVRIDTASQITAAEKHFTKLDKLLTVKNETSENMNNNMATQIDSLSGQ